MSDKIKLVRFSNVVPFGPGPGVREVQGGQPGVSLAVEPGLLVMCRVVKDSSGNMVHTTKVPLAHCTCIVYEPKREQLVSATPALAATRPPVQEPQTQEQPEPEESAEPTSEIVLEGTSEKPAPSPAAPVPATTPTAAKKPKANKLKS